MLAVFKELTLENSGLFKRLYKILTLDACLSADDPERRAFDGLMVRHGERRLRSIGIGPLHRNMVPGADDVKSKNFEGLYDFLFLCIPGEFHTMTSATKVSTISSASRISRENVSI